MCLRKLCFVSLAIIWSCFDASKILVVFPMPSRSHGYLGDGIVKHLLTDGHEVTYITALTPGLTSPNLRVVDVSSNTKALPEQLWTIEAITQGKVKINDHDMLKELLMNVMKSTIKNENVQKMLNNEEERFDAVIVEWLFSELPAGFATIYDCPLIWILSLDTHWEILNLIDQPSNPAYTGHVLSTVTPSFTFLQRVSELFTQIQVQYSEYMYYDMLEKQAYDKLLVPFVIKRGRNPPSFYEVQFNASLILANSHPSLGQAVPIPQSYIPVGGYYIEEDVKPLPDELKEIMDKAINGVIYFSMGSNLQSKDIPKDIKNGVMKMFGRLNQTVLWKLEEELPNTPKNVHILKWAPQQSILAHPNTIVFITHGGMLSSMEAIHFAVPIIGIPIFGDQFVNIARAMKRGYAQRVELSSTMVTDLKLAIEEVITNRRYREKAKELSFIYHDRPVSPGQELVHWVKHVIATRGALHLRSPALNVPTYQRLYLDLFAVIPVMLFLLVKLVKWIFWCSSSIVINVTSGEKMYKENKMK